MSNLYFIHTVAIRQVFDRERDPINLINLRIVIEGINMRVK